MAEQEVTRLQQQLKQLSALLALGQALGQVEDEAQMGHELARAMVNILPVTQWVLLRGDNYKETMPLMARWENGQLQIVPRAQSVIVEVSNTLASRIGRDGGLASLADYNVAKPKVRGVFGAAMQSGLAAPLIVGGEAVAALVVETTRTDAYDSIDLGVFSQLVAQLNNTLTRLSASFGMQRMAMTSTIVNSVSQRIQGETSTRGVLNSGALAALRALNAKRVSVRLGAPPSDDRPSTVSKNGSA